MWSCVSVSVYTHLCGYNKPHFMNERISVCEEPMLVAILVCTKVSSRLRTVAVAVSVYAVSASSSIDMCE